MASTPDSRRLQLTAMNMTDFCRTGMSEPVASAIIHKFLQEHFSAPENFFTQNLQQYLWNAKPERRKIQIVSNTTWNGQEAGKLPAVIIQRLPKRSTKIAIGDGGTISEDGSGSGNYVRMEIGSQRLYCIAESDGESEDLALEVFDALSFMSPVFRQQMPFHDFEVVGMGAPSLMEEMGNKIGCAIDIRYAYESGWIVRPQGPLLKTINLQVE